MKIDLVSTNASHGESHKMFCKYKIKNINSLLRLVLSITLVLLLVKNCTLFKVSSIIAQKIRMTKEMELWKVKDKFYVLMAINGDYKMCTNAMQDDITYLQKKDHFFENLLFITQAMLGFLIRSLKSKKSDFLLLVLG
jgi:hypothetical protein